MRVPCDAQSADPVDRATVAMQMNVYASGRLGSCLHSEQNVADGSAVNAAAVKATPAALTVRRHPTDCGLVSQHMGHGRVLEALMERNIPGLHRRVMAAEGLATSSHTGWGGCLRAATR